MNKHFAFVILAIAHVVSPRAQAQEPAYDFMHRSYGKYVAPDNSLAWPTKVRSIARDEYHFWRGTRDIFYDWCRTNCADWMADKDAIVISHGDLHFGNMGAYAIGLGKTAAGLVDFDESARLPFQLELLQGWITLDLVAKQNKVTLTDAQRTEMHQALFEAYFSALGDPQSAADRLEKDELLQAILNRAPNKSFADEVKKYCNADGFQPVILKKGQPVDLLETVPKDQWPGFADGIAEAITNDSRLAGLTALRSSQSVQGSIVAIARRTRVDSSGSQGLLKYMVRLRKPFASAPGDAILYLKEQIPSAPERARLVQTKSRSPGERCARDADELVPQPMLANSWCAVNGHSFWVSIKEPWSDELTFDAFTKPSELTHAARVFGLMAGASHAKNNTRLPKAWSPYLFEKVGNRGAAYLQFQQKNFGSFNSDLRTQSDVTNVEKRIADMKTNR